MAAGGALGIDGVASPYVHGLSLVGLGLVLAIQP
jgi:hypothetical protein